MVNLPLFDVPLGRSILQPSLVVGFGLCGRVHLKARHVGFALPSSGRASFRVLRHLSHVRNEGVLRLAESLAGVCVLLNCAGSFAKTVESLVRACIWVGAQYHDITAEINVYRLAERLGLRSARVDVMRLPGVAWDVVPTDCLALQFSRRVAHPVSPQIAQKVADAMSRGSTISAGEIVRSWLMARVDGALVYTQHATSALFNFGDGDENVRAVDHDARTKKL